MSRLFPHTPYAEDQPLSKTILTTHVLTRGFQAGSLVGGALSSTVYTYSYFRKTAGGDVKPFARVLLRGTGIGAFVGTALMAIAVPGRMWGKEDIEWKDRSWRLLENKGQLEMDDWTYPAIAISAATAVVMKQAPRMALGTVGLGSVMGMLGSIAWRQGGVKRDGGPNKAVS